METWHQGWGQAPRGHFVSAGLHDIHCFSPGCLLQSSAQLALPLPAFSFPFFLPLKSGCLVGCPRGAFPTSLSPRSSKWCPQRRSQPRSRQWPGTDGRLRTASGATRSFGRAHVCLLWCRASSPAAGLHFPTGCALNRAGCCSSARSVCAARSAPKPVGSRLPLLAAGSAPGVFLSPALPRTPLPPAPPDSPLGSGRRAQELGAPRGSP